MILTQRAKVPQAVIDGSDLATMLGMANLREKNRGGHLGQTVAETEEQPTDDVHCEWRLATAKTSKLTQDTYFHSPCRMRQGIHPESSADIQ